MGEIGADAVVFTNKPPILHSGGEKRYKTLEYLFGFTDEGAACLFYNGIAYFVTDSRYDIELREKFDGVSNLRLTITSDDPEDSCYLSVIRRAEEMKDRQLVLAANERVIHSKVYLSAIKRSDKVKLKNVDLFNWLCKDRPQTVTYTVDDVEDLGLPNSFDKIFSPRVLKLNAIAAESRLEDPNGFLIFSNPSDIAWILNIRCFDNAPTMLPPSVFILSGSKGYLFIQGRLGNKLAYDFSNLRSSEDGKSFVKEISVFSLDDFFNKAKYLVPFSSSIYFADLDYPAEMFNVFPLENYSCKPYDRFWFDKFKVSKTVEESQSIRLAFRFDSVAFASFLCRLKSGEVFKTETDVSDALLEERKKNKYFLSDSFPTISAFGPNGAICHYVPEKGDSSEISRGLLVLDFGTQYDFGTTDNTRTLAFGEPTAEEKRHYTAVLKSHIYLQMIDFPFGTDGYRLDFLARSILFEYGISVPHGIGHGVEMVGNVHADFPRLSSSLKNNVSLFKIYPGMVFTIEPGSYEEGRFGVRIENTVISVATDGKPGFMHFEPLTLMPYDLKLIDKSMLTEHEIAYINGYHGIIRDSIAKELDEGNRALFSEITSEV